MASGGDRAVDRSRDALAAAEEILPALVRSFLLAGLTPQALRESFDDTLNKWQEQCASTDDSPARRPELEDLAHVLSVWHTDPEFVDQAGAPRPLPQKGPGTDFETLAARAIPTAPAPAVLKRLLIAGVVDIDTSGNVRALRRELVTRDLDELGLWHWRQAARRHLETLEFNYSVPGEGRLERTAQSERLPANLLPSFNRWIRAQGSDFIQMADDWLTQHELPTESDNDAEDAVTAGIGIYLFVDLPEDKA